MRHVALLASTCLALSLNAQWSLDAANPMAVCDAPNAQRFMNALSDGGTGWYVFWSDLRNDVNKGQLYGQHFNEAGIAQWADNGQLILELPGRSVNEIAPVLGPGNDVFIAVLSSATNTFGADTVRSIRVNDQAQLVWAQPALLSINGTGIFGNCFGYSDPHGISTSTGAYFCYHGDSQGSNGYYVMQRVRGDGSVAFNVPGIQVPYNAGYAAHTAYSDGSDGMIVSWRCSGGVGTCARAIRVDSLGTAVWGSNLDITAGSGLGGANTMSTDGTGGFVAVWSDMNADIAMMRFDTTSAVQWNPSPQFACDESHDQQSPDVTVLGNVAYVAWTDNRPPANSRDLYMQKIDLTTGARLWNTDGVPVIQNNSYIPTARVVPSIDGAIGIMDFTGTNKYCAMRMNSDGTPAWAAPCSFATASLPNYGERVEFPDGEGGAVAFWKTYEGDLFGARIYPNGQLGDHTGMYEPNTEGMQIQPNPANDQVTLQWPASLDQVMVKVIASDGRLIDSWRPVGYIDRMDVTSWPKGCYVVRTEHSKGVITERFIKQ